MKFSEFFTSKDNINLDKKTLVALRWIALVGQYLTISIVFFIFQFELPFLLNAVTPQPIVESFSNNVIESFIKKAQ